jgi:dUTP pyrophosphatase
MSETYDVYSEDRWWVNIVYLDSLAEITTSSPCAVGYDLKSMETEILHPGDSKLFSTGIKLDMPPDVEAQIRPRSGIATKHKVIIPNSPGTIDPDYRGEVKVCLMNIGEKLFHVERGDRIAQIVFNKIYHPEIKIVHELSETIRGEGGFGSTGK